jgi:outer membrane protein assembly factor BamB
VYRCISGILGAALSTALLLTACSSSSDETPGGSPSPASGDSSPDQGSLPSFDSPRTFGGTPVPVELPALDANLAGDFTNRFTLADERLYGVTRTSVGAVDLATGRALWGTRFPNAPDKDPVQIMYDSRGPGAPILSEDGSTVYAVLVVEIPGSGTTSKSFASQLVAVNARTGQLSWSADIPAGAEVSSTGAQSVRVVAEAGGRVIVTRDGEGGITEGTVGAVDSGTHQVLWSRPGHAYAVTRQAIVMTAEASGSDANYSQLTGLDPASGKAKWTSGTGYDTAVSGLSTLQTDDRFVVTIDPYSGAAPYTVTLNPATGKITKRFPGVILSGPALDGSVVYDVSSTAGLRALDPATFKPIWALPQGQRIAPRHPVFFGGLVYGQVDNGTSVVLDGATGKDVTAEIPGSFIDVNEHGALMHVDEEVYFVPATG